MNLTINPITCDGRVVDFTVTPPSLNDNDGTDLATWLAGVRSFADDWPRGVLGCGATTAPHVPAIDLLSHGDDNAA